VKKRNINQNKGHENEYGQTTTTMKKKEKKKKRKIIMQTSCAGCMILIRHQPQFTCYIL
jgi:hypothetical protein